MNIFIIVSSYPNKSNPFEGIFVKNQTILLSKNYPDLNLFISLLGEQQYKLPLSKPHIAFRKFINYLKNNKKKINPINNNLIEVHNPTIFINNQFFNNFNKIIKATIDNYLFVEKNYGKIDLIHAHFSYPAGYIAYEISKIFHSKYVITEHMSPFPFKEFLNNNIIDIRLKQPLINASKIIAVSKYQKKRIESFGFKNVVYIPNYIDENYFYPIEKSRNSTFTFFTLCLISEQKGIDILIKAIKIINDQKLNVKFKIGGDGPLLKKYINYSKKLKLNNIIEWLGPLNQEQAKKQYQESDCFILPSRHESFGIVYIEALACGLPIIATKCGGPEEIVNDYNGILIEVDDVNGLVNAIKNVILNHEKFKSQIIRQDFLNRFSSKVSCSKINNLYKNIN